MIPGQGTRTHMSQLRPGTAKLIRQKKKKKESLAPTLPLWAISGPNKRYSLVSFDVYKNVYPMHQQHSQYNEHIYHLPPIFACPLVIPSYHFSPHPLHTTPDTLSVTID